MDINYIAINHGGIDFYLCALNCKTIVTISYVARRGESEEEGAVQRILNKSRITSISDYILEGGFFPTNIILNVVDESAISLNREEKTIAITPAEHIAQVLDGQHRVAGMKDAIKRNPQLGDVIFPVLLSVNLSTEQCADIFININTEQKTVPKSLIYDLYGLLNTSNSDYSIERGRDIAYSLNTEEESPYKGYIKFPGSPRFKGGIQLSSAVNAIKPLIKSRGEFERYQIHELKNQSKVLINYFNAIAYYYEKQWYELQNPFLFSSGFGAAIDLLKDKILPICFSKGDFSFEHFKSIFSFTKDNLLKQRDFSGKSGETAKQELYNNLVGLINVQTTRENELKF
ncbi:MAG: DGQHR domain-containing protein [Bacteroidales bacterium]|nr:DGQHR domain-containing protein [Bacteroidales bacterium]